jgi:hypothetical protein
MPEPLARPIGATRLKAKGRIAVPADYRKRHKLLEVRISPIVNTQIAPS